MKQLFTMLLVVAMAVDSCERTNPQSTESKAPEKEAAADYDTLATMQVVRHVVDSTGTYAITLEFPQGKNKVLKNAIEEYMSEMLGGNFEGAYADSAAMIDYYINNVVKTNHADYDDIYSNREHDDFPEVTFLDSVSLTKRAEGKDFVTYSFQKEVFSGGAHGGVIAMGQTFRKSDARRIGWEVFDTDKTELMQELMKNGLKEYWCVETDEQLQDFFMDRNNVYMVPTPQCPPLFMEDGVLFIYNQYEIAAYAAGMPAFKVPYEKVLPVLTVTGKRLVEDFAKTGKEK